MTAERVCLTHGVSGDHVNEDAPCSWAGPDPAEETPAPEPEPDPARRQPATFELDGTPAWSGTPIVNGHRLETVTSIDVRIRCDEIPAVTLGLAASDAVRLALGEDVAVGVTDETREALISLGWTPPGPSGWTPEQVAEFREQWDSVTAGGIGPVQVMPVPPAQLIVLRFCWTDNDGFPREEFYGPWPPVEDASHIEQVTAFIRDWPARSGYQPSSVTMALVQDPAAWAAGRQQQEGQ